MNEKLIIIGAGPAGMMASIAAKTHYPNLDVTILERNNEVGKKLKLTGGGRCNVTVNKTIDELLNNYPKNPKFLISSLNDFGPKEIINFFVTHNCPLKEENKGKIFPTSNKSQSIIDSLLDEMKRLKIKIIYNLTIDQIDPNKKTVSSNHKTFSYDYLIISSGGITYPQTGSDGLGHKLALTIGHDITKLSPTETSLVSSDVVITNKILQGLSFSDIRLSLLNEKNKVIKIIDHDLIFTHFGLSGPAALQMSYHVKKQLEKQPKVTLLVDFLPQYSLEEVNKLDPDSFKKLLKEVNIPKRLSDYLFTLNNLELIKKFVITINDLRGINSAFVTDGGINIKEIDPKTMKSKIDAKIAFCGEIIDYHGYTGGFNITAALSTGYKAGKYLLS